jgi:hypothetical protein
VRRWTVRRIRVRVLARSRTSDQQDGSFCRQDGPLLGGLKPVEYSGRSMGAWDTLGTSGGLLLRLGPRRH